MLNGIVLQSMSTGLPWCRNSDGSGSSDHQSPNAVFPPLDAFSLIGLLVRDLHADWSRDGGAQSLTLGFSIGLDCTEHRYFENLLDRARQILQKRLTTPHFIRNPNTNLETTLKLARPGDLRPWWVDF